jgi:hypothetical protein
LPHGKRSERDPQSSRALEVFQVLKRRNCLSFNLRGTRIVQCESFSRLSSVWAFHFSFKRTRSALQKNYSALKTCRALKELSSLTLYGGFGKPLSRGLEQKPQPQDIRLTQIQSGAMPISKLLSRQ